MFSSPDDVFLAYTAGVIIQSLPPALLVTCSCKHGVDARSSLKAMIPKQHHTEEVAQAQAQAQATSNKHQECEESVKFEEETKQKRREKVHLHLQDQVDYIPTYEYELLASCKQPRHLRSVTND